jgi:hypothetical protein
LFLRLSKKENTVIIFFTKRKTYLDSCVVKERQKGEGISLNPAETIIKLATAAATILVTATGKAVADIVVTLEVNVKLIAKLIVVAKVVKSI